MQPRALIQGWIYWYGKIFGSIYFDRKGEYPDGHSIRTSVVHGKPDEHMIIKTSSGTYYILGMRAEQVDSEREKFAPLNRTD